MIRRLFFAVLLVSIGLNSAAQTSDDVIRMKSRVFIPTAGVDPSLATYFRRSGATGKAHVLMQFRSMPTIAERATLRENDGVVLLDRVPERAFFASMPRSLPAATRLTTSGRVRWIGPIASRDKLAPSVASGKIPPHAQRGRLAEFIVEFFGDIDAAGQARVLQKGAARTLNQIPEINAWRIHLTPRNLSSLAQSDEVKWIVEVPPPPEDLNDGVRSATGVNADAVLPPSDYSVSGTGVAIGLWDVYHASITHLDLAGRATIGDPPIVPSERGYRHTETVAADGDFELGEAIFIDMDDSDTVSPGDVRLTTVGAFAPGSVVSGGDADAGAVAVRFHIVPWCCPVITAEFYVDSDQNGRYDEGEPIYRAPSWLGVAVGNVRLTPVGIYAAGSIVAAGDTDVGGRFSFFADAPHYHATHVAGTMIGNGSQSNVSPNWGSPGQWRGVASSATIRSYLADVLHSPRAQYLDAVAHDVTISSNSWGTGGCQYQLDDAQCYDPGTEAYDVIVSGRRSDGMPSGLPHPVLIVASAGNQGAPERYADTVVANGQYDDGEAVYRDQDSSATVSAGDNRRTAVGSYATGSWVDASDSDVGRPLTNFRLTERHAETGSIPGWFDQGEAVYADLDDDRLVSPGDRRISAVGAYAAGSFVAAGDADIGTLLRSFKMWGNVQVRNSGKNTLTVANITSDTDHLSPSSSKGPTPDGRMKPDISGPGSEDGNDEGVTSAYPGNRYISLTGTSMATPAVSGSAALLTEWYRTACIGAPPDPAILRALLIHSAEDLVNHPHLPGNFAGPDFAFGYGRARVKEALDLMTHHRVAVASALGDTNYPISTGAGPLKVTLVWSDPAWTANAIASPSTGILQNDLDLMLIAPNGDQYTPWINGAPDTVAVLNVTPAGTPVPASARDHRNTVEQVVVPNAMAGTWTVRVTASLLAFAPQPYVLVSEAFRPEESNCLSTPAGDVWMRDTPTDTGAVPSPGAMWISPDVWNRKAPDGLTTHENPEYGQTNYLYANIRNRGAGIVRATTLSVWIAPAATGLIWPDTFTLVGQIAVPNLAAGTARAVGPIPWQPPNPSPSDHYCLYARLASPQDPIVGETSDVNANAVNSNNLVYRNVQIVDLSSSRSVTFLIRNTEAHQDSVDIRVTVPPEFLRTGRVRIRLGHELARRWTPGPRGTIGLRPIETFYVPVEGSDDHGEAAPRSAVQPPPRPAATPTVTYELTGPEAVLGSIPLGAHEAQPVTLTFMTTAEGETSHEISVVQQTNGRTVGGIEYIVRHHGAQR